MADIIDAHAHVISADRKNFPPVRSDNPAIDEIIARDFNVLTLQVEMARAGVGRALLVQRGQIYGTDNLYVCSAARSMPKQFYPVCAINARVPGCEALAHEWHEAGAIGFRLMGGLMEQGFDWLDGPHAQGLWRTVADLGAPMCVHFFPRTRSAGLDRLDVLMKEYPDVVVVVDHLTNPLIADVQDAGIDRATERLSERRHAYLKFTTIPLLQLDRDGIDSGAVLRRYAGLFGAERMMWGSDITQSPGTYADMVELARRAVASFDDATQMQFFGRTAASVYRI